ncbi:transcriptional regulator AraC family [Clostridium sp. CAG:1013]|nr:transcriptional regulator AraC family [Clostridium sp. CAG:1013]
MSNAGFSQEIPARRLDVQCNGYDPSSNMERTHYHDCFEVYYQISGDRYLLSNGKFTHLEAGDMLWIKSFDLHQSFQGQAPNGIRAVMYFSEEYLREVFQDRADELLALFTGPFRVMRLDSPQQRKTLELLYELEQAAGPGQELYARFVFGQLLLLLESWSKTGLPLPQESPSIDPKYDRIAGVLTYLKSHRSEKLRLEEVAREFFVTPSYLSRSFKECMGITFVSYINHLKIQRAKELLCREKSVTQVSMELGFDTLTHFERVFKSITGMSPTAWKKQWIPTL